MTDYSQLQSDIVQYSARSDAQTSVPMFIRLAHAELNRRIKHTLAQETRITFTFSSPDYSDTLPDDYLGLKRLRVEDSQNPRAQYIGPDQFAGVHELSPADLYAIQGDAQLLYTIEASEILVNQPRGIADPIEIAAVYYARFPALSESNTTNWLLTNHYDFYLYASLKQLWLWADETEEVMKFGQLLDKIMPELDDQEREMRRQPGALRRTPPRGVAV